MINDIQVSCPSIFNVIFADDDSALVEDISLEGVIDKANQALSNLVDWYSSNKLAIHPSKSKAMLFHNSNRRNNNNLINVQDDIIASNSYFPLFINLNNDGECNVTKISYVKMVPNSEEQSIKILGFLLDDKLNLKSHIDLIHSKVSRALYSLKQMKHILDGKHLKLLFSAYIKSHIDYADIFYCLCTKKTLNPLELLYKKAIRIISGVSYRDHTNPLFIQHKILPIKENSELNILKIMYRCDHNDIPNCIKDTWRRNRDISGRDGRNANKFHQEVINAKYLENSPYFYFPKLFNDLPDTIKTAVSEKEFTKKVKAFLFNRLREQI